MHAILSLRICVVSLFQSFRSLFLFCPLKVYYANKRKKSDGLLAKKKQRFQFCLKGGLQNIASAS